MPVKCQQIINWIEELAPKKLSQEWDNIGLQIGDPRAEVSKALIALDLNMQVVEEAIQKQAQLIICHHPYIFQPIKNLRQDLPQGQVLSKLIKEDIGLYAAHTNWDSAEMGVSHILADIFQLENREVLKITKEEALFKIVVFVPHGHQDEVRQGLSRGGAGYIGNYSECTFMIDGIGTFKPDDNTNPYIGQLGQLEKVAEYRLETVVSESKLKRAIKEMLQAHPYEEVAYDIIPIENKGKSYGLGVIGQLANPCQLDQILATLKEKLGVTYLKVVGDREQKIKKVALCGGSGGDLINAAVFKGADVLITGDVSYHQAQNAQALGLALVDAGHYATELPAMAGLCQLLEKKIKTNQDLQFIMSTVNTDPWKYY